jgi:hypothetical protein
MLYALLTTLDEWLIRRGWRTAPAPPETFPLPWCDPENRADCGIYACCLYTCWDGDD